MATVLEARAIITAEDRTGPAFAAIEKHIAAIGKQATAINAVSRQVSKVSSGVAQTSRGIAQRAAAQSQMGGMGMGGVGLGAVRGLLPAIGGAMVAHAAVKASVARAHEQVRMEAAGMTRAEIADAQIESAKLAAKFPSLGQTEIMHMLRNARSIVGSYSEAAEIMEPLAKLRIVAQAARPGEDITEDFDKLVKGLEIKGVTQDLPQFKRYMEGMAKAVNVFGDTLKPVDYYEMFKLGRQSTTSLSEAYMLKVAPTLAQELGGPGAGVAQSAFHRAIVAGKMDKGALAAMQEYGLIDPNKVVKKKGGDLASVKPGGIVGSALAALNPYEWVNQILLPALAKKGVVDPDKIQQVISTLFSKSTAAQMVGIYATQQARIEKDARMVEGSKGLEAADLLSRKDPRIAWDGLKNSVGSLAGTLGEGTATALAGPMTDMAQAIAGYTARLEALYKKDKENPDAIAPAGQDGLNRTMNRLFFGTDSDKSMSQAKAEAERKYRAGEMDRLDLDFAQKSEKLWRAGKIDAFNDLNGAEWRRTEAQHASEAADAAVSGYGAASRFPIHGGPRGAGGPPILGSGAFSPSLGYGNYDAGTGAPKQSPSEQIAEAVKNIKLEPVSITGEATVTGNFTVEASSEFMRIVEKAKQVSTQMPLSTSGGGGTSSTGHPNAALGPSMPEAAPRGQSGGL
jgi:hypothetical protein